MSSDLLWTLIALQIVLGDFDTLYHHEFAERLAWRASQRHELQLHAMRNGIYAPRFLVLGWFGARSHLYGTELSLPRGAAFFSAGNPIQ
jgi:hypothetical protein